SGNERQRKIPSQSQGPDEQQRKHRPKERADTVHRPFESVSAPISFRRRRLGHQHITNRSARTAPDPSADASKKHVPPLRSEGEAGHPGSGDKISDHRQRLSPAQAIGIET